jgi:hypothetical protein
MLHGPPEFSTLLPACGLGLPGPHAGGSVKVMWLLCRVVRGWRRRGGIPAACLCCTLILFAGCAPGQRLDAVAPGYGFERELVAGTRFQHVLYRNYAGVPDEAVLHVYLDGDGLPWRTRYRVSSDPTPRQPLVLSLMAQDPGPSVYLARPCYNGQADAPGCGPQLWTSGRYGPEVVSSMKAALTRVLAGSHFAGVVLIGYSGGGALAMLLAREMKETRGVITIAGNLNPARWAELHDYSPLSESMNPAEEPPLSAKIRQLHYVGSLDSNVPPDMVRAATRRQPRVSVVVVDGFDHRCCWETMWPSIVKRFQTGSPAPRETVIKSAFPAGEESQARSATEAGGR